VNNQSWNSINNNQFTNIVNRPYGWGANGSWNGYYNNLHNDWYHGSWSNWNYQPAVWGAATTAFGWLLGSGQSLAYANPYYAAPASSPVINQFVDYSQPIQVPATPLVVQTPTDLPVSSEPSQEVYSSAAPTPAPPPPPAPAGDSDTQQQARNMLDDAVAAFKKGEYPEAQRIVESAIELLPGDTILHEFRAQTLFAQGKYSDAAAAVYAVLAAGPGWDWDTLRSFYPDVDTYKRQLRALERYQREHPDKADASFVLAAQYLSLGSTDAAIKQLEHVVAVQPKDQLSAQILKVLKQPPVDSDKPSPGV
jgi:tetratricopeptide (TPR) repeat protein